jgi:hypothetical protein
MIGTRQPATTALEWLDTHPAVAVEPAEYRRLLGYPRDHELGERARELSTWAAQWYAAHGHPWVYLRDVGLELTDAALRIDGIEFGSAPLRDLLQGAQASRVMLAAVSAGRDCEEHARQLWQEAKPDEYFFLEIYGSAVVEHLVAALNGRICDLAGRDGLMAVPHYSPGYTGWDIADQHRLFDMITRGRTLAWPENLDVLGSGMLRPKKSLIAVVGLAPRTATAVAAPAPCEACAYTPCQYRRRPYRHAVAPVNGSRAPMTPAASAAATAWPLTRNANYSVNARALRKWAQERVRINRQEDGSLTASFRFDGTTCSNLGRPLAFDYSVTLSSPESRCTILEADCRPASNDTGHMHMCAFIEDAEGLMTAIATEKPLLGQPLDEVLQWVRAAAPSGCHCTAVSRAHKWGLALEAIHYALAVSAEGSTAPSTAATIPRSANVPFSS